MLKKRSPQSDSTFSSTNTIDLPFNEFDLWAREVKRQMIAVIKKRETRE